jgi:hypothetical protein
MGLLLLQVTEKEEEGYQKGEYETATVMGCNWNVAYYAETSIEGSEWRYRGR